MDPRFPAAGLPFPVPEILEFVAFRDSGKFFQQFSPELSCRTPAQTPETATAFSSFLKSTRLRAFQAPPSHRSGHYASGVCWGPRIPFCAADALWGGVRHTSEEENPPPKKTHPNKKSLRKQFSGLFVQTVLPLSFKLNKRHAERVWANCLHKLFSVEFIGVGGFLGWVFLP